MKIDIERLIDAVTAENEAYNEYCHSSKTLYRGPFEEITARTRFAGLSLENPRHLIALVNIAECGRHRRTAADHPPRLRRIY